MELVHQRELEAVEAEMLDMPQVECPVAHHFGPGTYIREVTMPAGTFALGHHQKFPQLNVMLTGVVRILAEDGSVNTLTAPLIFVGQPGRKMGYVVETCTWLNVFPNPDDERDIEALESKWIDKSATWQEHTMSSLIDHEEDRKDFLSLIDEAGFSPEVVRQQSVNEADQIGMPEGFGAKVTIRKSPIEGNGLFLSSPAEIGELIAPARIAGFRTPAGRYTNHSKTPNAKFVMADSGDINLVATRRIAGCCGGDQGEEVTVDYRQALALSGIYLKSWGQP